MADEEAERDGDLLEAGLPLEGSILAAMTTILYEDNLRWQQ